MYQYIIEDPKGLSDEEIMHYAPAVFAPEKHESRSSRFAYISTGEVLQALRSAGFVPTKAMQSSPRDKTRLGYTKHLLRLRRVQDIGSNLPDVREVVLRNASDGTAAFDLMCGVFRLVCSNGLIVWDREQEYKVYHKGDVAGKVVEGSIEIIEEGEHVMHEIEEMKQIQLSQPERLLLAQFAYQARFDVDEETPKEELPVFQPQDLLRPRRAEDTKTDLYTTFNVLQENTIKGGLSRRDRKGNKHTTKRINGIDQNVKLNKMLWSLAEEMKKLKS